MDRVRRSFSSLRVTPPLAAHLALLAAVLIFSACVSQTHAEAPPATQPAPAARLDPELEQWLDRIAAKGRQTRTFKADLRYDRNQLLQQDKQRRFGSVVYVVGPPAKFAVHLDRLVADGRLDKQNRWYIFDGRWLIERLDDQKHITRREVVPPNAPADQANPLALGEGPFALPVTLDKQKVLARYDVKLVEPAEGDPKNTIHLRLTPREGTKNDLTVVDFWYDKETLLPSRARTEDESGNESIITITKPRVNEEVDEKAFVVPEMKDYRVEIMPYEG